MPLRLLFDCDPGHDDVLAILAAARYGELVGITAAAGNAAFEHTTHNALVTCELGGIDVPAPDAAGFTIEAPPNSTSGPTRKRDDDRNAVLHLILQSVANV